MEEENVTMSVEDQDNENDSQPKMKVIFLLNISSLNLSQDQRKKFKKINWFSKTILRPIKTDMRI